VLLIYNHATDCYEGERLRVPSRLRDDAVAELVKGGTDETEARRVLLEEAQWQGVEGAGLLPLCLHCRAPLVVGKPFCGVLCEARFIAAVKS
jgi:hypothetical protein